MRTIILTKISAAIRCTGASAVWLPCMLGLGLPASAQDIHEAAYSKEVATRQLIKPRHDSPAGVGVMRNSAAASQDSPARNASKQIVLHQFSSAAHGAYPSSGVIRDVEGNLYGTTNGSYSDIGGGGTRDAGVVFKIDPSGSQTVLYSFTGGADGSSPNGLIRDSAGNLYGTTNSGGASGAGVVFEVDSSGNEIVLYSFTGGADGGNPLCVVRDGKGNFYGTTSSGGASGYGVVFKLSASGAEKVVYSFTGGADGANPNTNIALDSLGNLYGSTNGGGSAVGTSGSGVVFKVDPTGHETVLHTFTGEAMAPFPMV